MRTFAERVEAMEVAVGGPAALARAAGISTAAVAQWKRSGKAAQLKAAPLLTLAKNTGVRPAWVVFGTGAMMSSDGRTASSADLVGELAAAVASLSRDEREALGATLAGWIKTADTSDRMAAAIRGFLDQRPAQTSAAPEQS